MEPSKRIELLFPDYETGVFPLYDDGINGTPSRIRIGILSVKGIYPKPLDDGCIKGAGCAMTGIWL